MNRPSERGSAALVPRGPLPSAAIGITVGLVAAVALLAGSLGAPSGSSSVASTPTLPQAVPCPGTSAVDIAGASYTGCNATLDWSGVGLYPSTSETNHSYEAFDGVSFDVFGYVTEDCPVVNVTGHESSGASASFLIYPTPSGCQFVRPTVVAPDGRFAASWTGGPDVVLLVRAR